MITINKPDSINGFTICGKGDNVIEVQSGKLSDTCTWTLATQPEINVKGNTNTR